MYILHRYIYIYIYIQIQSEIQHHILSPTWNHIQTRHLRAPMITGHTCDTGAKKKRSRKGGHHLTLEPFGLKKKTRKELTCRKAWLVGKIRQKKSLFDAHWLSIFLGTNLWFFLGSFFFCVFFFHKRYETSMFMIQREKIMFFCCWIFVGSRSISFQWPMCFLCWGTVYKQKFSPSSSNMSSYLEGDWPGPICK